MAIRRTTYAAGTTAAIVALAAVIFGGRPFQSPSDRNAMIAGANDEQEVSLSTVSVDRAGSIVSTSQGLASEPKSAPVHSLTDSEKIQCLDSAKAARIAYLVREQATREVTPVYSLLFEKLDLTESEKDALFKLLIEIRVAATHTDCQRGKKIDPQDRSDKIAAIIEEPKLQQLLSLEQNIRQYSEVLYMQNILEKHEVPMTEAQRNRMLDILIEIQDQDLMVPGADADHDSIEYLEYRLARMDERVRLVFEQAASVLSAEQVEYLFAQYQLESNRRAEALERQKKARSQGDESLPLYYPARSDPDDSP